MHHGDVLHTLVMFHTPWWCFTHHGDHGDFTAKVLWWYTPTYSQWVELGQLFMCH